MRLIPYLILISLLFNSCGGNRQEIFVAPDGNDQNSGQQNAPLQSLQRALELVKDLREKDPESDLTIYLRRGTYYLDRPLVFDAIHSGTPEHPLQLTAYRDEAVTISGARHLELNWSAGEGPLLQAELKADQPFDQLYLNGRKQIRARYPNYDPDILIYNGYATDAIAPERISTWSRPETGVLHAMHRAEWGGYHYRITGVNAAGEATLEGGFQNNRQMGMHREFRFVENIREELDAPGEWYYDDAEERLYYFPAPDLDPDTSRAEIASLEHLFEFRGSKDAPVHDITVAGLEFRHTRSTYMRTKEPLLRSDWAIYRGGALLLEGTENILIQHNQFRQLGGNAVFVNQYNRKTNISTNLFEQIGASAIALVGSPEAVRSPSFEYHEWVAADQLDREPGPKNNDYPAQALIEGNLIRDIDTIEKQVAGVQISMASGITLRHNTIYNTPRAGINVSEGTWGGHMIEYNDVFNTVLETGDHGAFNSWGRDRFWHPNRQIMDSLTRAEPGLILLDAQNTTTIRNNRFRCDHGWDIDLDDGSSNYHIYNNLCLNGGIKLREGFHRTVENNIMINNSFHPHVWFEGSHDVFRRNIVMTWYKPIRLNGWGDEIDYNLLPDSAALSRSHELGLDTHGGYGNPDFLDPGTGDFRVADASPALALGFENFPMDSFGVMDPKLRAMADTPEISAPLFFLPKAGSSSPLVDFLGAQVSDIRGLGERSAAGLDSDKGVMVRTVPAESLAGKVGLQAGDVLISLNNHPVERVAQLMEHYQGESWRGAIELSYIRNQEQHKLDIKL
ncbi:PDZ domain-containing protein [Flavilitoribacter nigricans]|uniref:Peptide-binding protein n=1 Tax=Flavilitoribacter nigricans (strain ATCC 23147 / DSM 23189 / NBRC 102662 / NCIMB 1420 / SS-2) TaxID=1122177 RepID=A0A2D0N3X2_FLAN2|nr:PDZ domain-containing protein [Flavilitoribacter nigricans]PHN03221.1 peptide-binding protein [Flavilitoribacter nigricans DSM 23189 = NBRC 102662]